MDNINIIFTFNDLYLKTMAYQLVILEKFVAWKNNILKEKSHRFILFNILVMYCCTL